ncbi:MAG TPA: DUF6600 domain-containing protein [Pyrinomonadaceae bacterium]|jgi:hypothetical protein
MRHNARTLLLSILLAALCALTTHAAADDNTDADRYDYDETARVARISLLSGDVSLKRAGQKKWERAALNFPLVEGDRLATGAGSRVEIQIDARNFVRLGEYTTLDLVSFRDEGVALSVPEGTVTLRLARFDAAREYFEFDAPKTTVAAEQTGLYRLDVAASGSVRVTAREGARARLYNDTSGFTLRDGRTAELTYDDRGEGDWSFAAARDFDTWDRWNDERERYLALRLRYDDRDRYYDRDIYGAEELDAYGDWVYARDYGGYVWRPRLTVVNNYYDWVPYRYGRWVWCPPYGWTWVGDEPWGWAPYHYGRWVYYDNSWCWAPRGYYHYSRRSWWRPALVAFVFNSNSSHVAWYPLGYHQPDPHARYRQPDRLTPLRAGEIAQLQRVNPIYQRAVTALPARDFGATGVRARPAPADLAQRALNDEPVRGRLPIRPTTDGASDNGANAGRNADRERPRVGVAARTEDAAPERRLPERPTGAAARIPGRPLDAELQRGRIFNNREPRTPPRDSAGGLNGTRPDGTSVDRSNDAPADRPTGAVTRPARPPRSQPPDTTRDNNGTRGNTDERLPVGTPADGGERPQPDFRRPRPAPSEREDRPAPVERRPVTPEVRPVERAKPAPVSPEERHITPAPRAERPAPSDERPAPKYERPEPKYERPAPPPREERPSAPPPREERPAPREERSAPREERSAPPPKEERAAPKEERRADPPREREAPAKVSRSREDPPASR